MALTPESFVGASIQKKVVLLHSSGLHRIVGSFDPSVHTLREFVEFDVMQNGKAERIEASLFQVQPRYVIYRQVMKTTKGILGEFHPSQR